MSDNAMEETSTGPCRRAGSARKRSRESNSRECRKRHQARSEEQGSKVSESDGELASMVTAEQNVFSWIDNSFLCTQKTPEKVKRIKSDCDGVSHVRSSIPAQSTPKSHTSTRQGFQAVEDYACQHDSFNDTDPVWGEMSLLETITEAGDTSTDTCSTHCPLKPLPVQTPDSHPCTLPNERPNVGRSFSEKLKSALRQNANKPVTPCRNIPTVSRPSISAVEECETWAVGPFYGLPSKVQELLVSHRGISELYDWQKECLKLPAVREGRNLIYSLPTSGGKTLVAEMLLLRTLLCHDKDAMLVLPFVSIVQEKVRGLSPFAVDLDFLVEEYAASKGTFPPKKRRKKKSIYICTIEKASSLVNSFIEAKRLEDIGLCVVDELHMLGEGGSRGATLELCLAKLLHCSSSTQVVGMSATLSNIQDLAAFLGAEVYSNTFRPVELTEHVKSGETVYEINNKALCPDDQLVLSRIVTFQYDSAKLKADPDHIAGLVLEVIPEKSCLVFCPTKKNCENVALLLCRLMSQNMKDVKSDDRRALVKALLHDGNGHICPVLQKTVLYGVAYHHSGLTMDERKLIEEAYSEGTLCVLACTSTLAAGVNLPAKRVILRSPYVGRSFLSRSQYLQMVGRAGRAGLDSSGESILVIQNKDRTKLQELIGGPLDHCRSSLLYGEQKGLKELLLTAVGLGITPSPESVCAFIHRTLCHIQSSTYNYDLLASSNKALKELIEMRLMCQQKSEAEGDESCRTLEVTDLGRAVFKGNIDVDQAQQLYKDLGQARDALYVSTHLHLLYLVTPYDLVELVTPHWMTYLDELSHFDESELKVAAMIGVRESYITQRVAGQKIRQAANSAVITRFYLTLMLYRLWKQTSLWQVATQFQQTRGFVQQLLSGAASFATCVSRFCEELKEFWSYQALLPSFVKRLSYCVTPELIPIMEISGVKIGRAQQLYLAGYKTLQQIANAESSELVRSIEFLPRRTATQIIASAKMLLQEKAESLIEEANDLLTLPTDTSNSGEQAGQLSVSVGASPVKQ